MNFNSQLAQMTLNIGFSDINSVPYASYRVHNFRKGKIWARERRIAILSSYSDKKK